MKRFLSITAELASSRAVTPLVLFCFLLIYIGIAFYSPEPLVTLIGLTGSTPLAVLFAAIPLNCLFRLVTELRRFMARRAAIKGDSAEAVPAELFDETCEISSVAGFEALEARLRSFGYRTRLTAESLAAWRGADLAPARLLLLATWVLLFTGILLSVTMRSTQRETVIEGEPFLHDSGGSGTVKRIVLEGYHGLFLERTVAIEVADAGGRSRRFGLYPPALHAGRFVYPRYLGIAPQIRFIAPDLPEPFESFLLLAIYPPGKEDSATIPGSPYRIVFTLAAPETGNDPFRSGQLTLDFKILKGDRSVASGNLPVGGSFEKDGFRLSFPEFRRLVVSDLVRDFGVFPIWTSVFTGLLAVLSWLPVRLFFARGEMLFIKKGGLVVAYSRAEGARRRQNALFHDALDFLYESPHDN